MMQTNVIGLMVVAAQAVTYNDLAVNNSAIDKVEDVECVDYQNLIT